MAHVAIAHDGHRLAAKVLVQILQLLHDPLSDAAPDEGSLGLLAATPRYGHDGCLEGPLLRHRHTGGGLLDDADTTQIRCEVGIVVKDGGDETTVVHDDDVALAGACDA